MDQWHTVQVGAKDSIITKDFRILFPEVDQKLSGPEDAVNPAVSITMWLDGYNLWILTQLVEEILKACPARHILTPLLPAVITHIVLKARVVQHRLLAEIERAQL